MIRSIASISLIHGFLTQLNAVTSIDEWEAVGIKILISSLLSSESPSSE
jgi:hypothetical protein